MKKAFLVMLILFIQVIVLSGCGTIFKQPSIEEMGMIGVMGFDKAKGKEIDLSVVLPVSLPQQMQMTKAYDAKATLTHEGLTKISRESDRTVNLGQLRVVLFSSALAKKRCIDRYMKDLYRNPQVGDQVLIAIVDGNVSKLLKEHASDQEPIGKFLYNFLAPREDIAFSPFTTIHSYMYHDTDHVTDPMVPIITEKSGQLDIDGVALFKNGKMIDTIQAQDAKLLQGLTYRHKLPALKLKLSDHEEAMLSFVKSKFDIDSNHSLTHPKLSLQMNLTGILDDYNGNKDLTKPANLKKLEQESNKALTKETKKLIKRFQKLHVDPVGLGENVRAQYPLPWSKERWDDALAHADIKVTVSTEIVSTGMLK